MAIEREILHDGRNYVSEDGDVLAIDVMVDPVTPRPDVTEYMMVPVPDSELDGPKIRAIKEALGKQAFLSTIEEWKNGTLDAAKALEEWHAVTGFFPSDNEEKGRMQDILVRSGGAYPTFRYLQEVAHHQRKIKANPTQTLRSIANDFESYAFKANTEIRHSRQFAQDIESRTVDVNQSISNVFSFEDIMNSDPIRQALTSIARLEETKRFINDGGENPIEKKSGIDSLVGKQRINGILMLLDGKSLKEVMELNSELGRSQINRFKFWRDQLEEATMVSAIQPQAFRGVEKLDKLRPLTSLR